MNLVNQIKIIISKHAIQRIEHYTPIEKDVLINLVKQILKKYKKDNIIDILRYSNLFTYEYRWKYSRWK